MPSYSAKSISFDFLNQHHFIVTLKKKILFILRHGRLKTDFAYVHNYHPLHGIVVNLTDEIVIPFRHGDYRLLGYYTSHGEFIGSEYIYYIVHHCPIQTQGLLPTQHMRSECIYYIHTLLAYSTILQLPGPNKSLL